MYTIEHHTNIQNSKHKNDTADVNNIYFSFSVETKHNPVQTEKLFLSIYLTAVKNSNSLVLRNNRHDKHSS